MERQKGSSIALAGVAGSGKVLQARRLVDYLKAEHKRVAFTREFYGVEAAEQIGDLLARLRPNLNPVSQAYLSAAARGVTIRTIDYPTINNGGIVVKAGSIVDAMAYHGWARELSFDRVLRINQEVVTLDREFDLIPDKILFLNMLPEEALRRLTAESPLDTSRSDREPLSHHQTAYEGYRRLFEMVPSFGERTTFIEMKGSDEDVHQRIVNATSEFLAKKQELVL